MERRGPSLMDWAEICIHTTQEGSEIISNVLHEIGSNGVVIEDQSDLEKLWDTAYGEIYEFNPDNYPKSGVHIKGYLPIDENVEVKISRLRARLDELKDIELDLGKKTIEIARINDEDWSEAWKQYYKPIRVSNRFTITPTWENYSKRHDDELVITLDPGMAFGTGTHATTTLCIRALEKYLEQGDNVIDVGTGTGVLSIAAALLGAKRVYAYDLDSVAVQSAKGNIEINGVSSQIEVSEGHLLDQVEQSADVIVANLLAPLIIQLVDDLPKKLKKSGRFIASGVIKSQLHEVKNAIESIGLIVDDVMIQDDWVALVATREENE